MRSNLAIAGMALLLTIGRPLFGDNEVSVEHLKTRIVSISLFKNGLGLVSREGDVARDDATALIGGLPVPVHGTFWVYATSEGTEVKDLVSFRQEVVQKVEAISIAELLEANVGQQVILRVGDKETLQGKILSVVANRESDPSPPAPRLLAYPVQPGETASLVLIETAEGIMALNKNAIQQVRSLGTPLKTQIGRKTQPVTLRLRVSSPRGKGHLAVVYLAKGMMWVPSYAIDITHEKKARLTSKAEIINEVEDLDEATVNFITGFPNLQFADVADPVALRGDMASFLESLLNPPQAQQGRTRRSALSQQAVVVNAPYGSSEEMLPAYGNLPLEGQAGEELFFYQRKGVTLRKGERGYYPLFTLELPFEHLYEWKISDVLDDQEHYANRDDREPEKAGEVWHSIRLTNIGQIPWTTAPAMILEEGQILGQDLLYYTSVGGKTTVRITQAVDVKAEQAELEVERRRNAASFYGSSYDLIVVKGKLKVGNFKNRDITLHITKDLSGEVVSTGPEANVERIAKGLRRVNPHSVLKWELPIKARDKLEVDYSYRVYVRS